MTEEKSGEIPKKGKIATRLFGNMVVTINPELNKYDDVVLFPEKVEKARAYFAKHGIPDFIKQQVQNLPGNSDK